MSKLKKNLQVAFFILLIQGCGGTMKPSDYSNEKPKLDLKQFFNGRVTAWGIFQDRSGNIKKRFKVVINCSWKNDIGTLDEDFLYSDGSTQKRIWTLRKINENNYIGTAEDVIGKAKGIVEGNTLNWKYKLLIPINTKNYIFDFDDWMFLVDENVLINRATMSKFGIRVGDVTISFMKNNNSNNESEN
tara:strand:+ start:1418 stop:1981 length:564 start_codon:yes stop_codon:yes gene_type:complete